jgi:hypothetical protein
VSLSGLKVAGVDPDISHQMGIPRKTGEITGGGLSTRGMHVCPSCSSELVQPVQWFEEGDAQWHVELCCPECEWWGRGSFSQPDVDRFDEQLDRGAQELLEDLRALTRSNMEQEIASFTEALDADLVLPEDF